MELLPTKAASKDDAAKGADWPRSLGLFLLGLVVIWLLLEAALASSSNPGLSLAGGLIGLVVAWRAKLVELPVLRFVTAGFSIVMIATGLALIAVG